MTILASATGCLSAHNELLLGDVVIRLMMRSFGLGILGTRNVYIGMSVLLVVTSGNKSYRDTLNVNKAN